MNAKIQSLMYIVQLYIYNTYVQNARYQFRFVWLSPSLIFLIMNAKVQTIMYIVQLYIVHT